MGFFSDDEEKKLKKKKTEINSHRCLLRCGFVVAWCLLRCVSCFLANCAEQTKCTRFYTRRQTDTHTNSAFYIRFFLCKERKRDEPTEYNKHVETEEKQNARMKKKTRNQQYAPISINYARQNFITYRRIPYVRALDHLFPLTLPPKRTHSPHTMQKAGTAIFLYFLWRYFYASISKGLDGNKLNKIFSVSFFFDLWEKDILRCCCRPTEKNALLLLWWWCAFFKR